jgi:hypothetical protein
MNHGLLGEIFRCARDYHGALREYAAAMRAGADIESTAQRVIGTSVRYRVAIDRLLEADDPKAMAIVATHGRLERLRRLLVVTSHRYNLLKSPPGREGTRLVPQATRGKRISPQAHVGRGPQATARRRSMSWRTVS